MNDLTSSNTYYPLVYFISRVISSQCHEEVICITNLIFCQVWDMIVIGGFLSQPWNQTAYFFPSVMILYMMQFNIGTWKWFIDLFAHNTGNIFSGLNIFYHSWTFFMLIKNANKYLGQSQTSSDQNNTYISRMYDVGFISTPSSSVKTEFLNPFKGH